MDRLHRPLYSQFILHNPQQCAQTIRKAHLMHASTTLTLFPLESASTAPQIPAFPSHYYPPPLRTPLDNYPPSPSPPSYSSHHPSRHQTVPPPDCYSAQAIASTTDCYSFRSISEMRDYLVDPAPCFLAWTTIDEVAIAVFDEGRGRCRLRWWW